MCSGGPAKEAGRQDQLALTAAGEPLLARQRPGPLLAGGAARAWRGSLWRAVRKDDVLGGLGGGILVCQDVVGQHPEVGRGGGLLRERMPRRRSCRRRRQGHGTALGCPGRAQRKPRICLKTVLSGLRGAGVSSRGSKPAGGALDAQPTARILGAGCVAAGGGPGNWLPLAAIAPSEPPPLASLLLSKVQL